MENKENKKIDLIVFWVFVAAFVVVVLALYVFPNFFYK